MYDDLLVKHSALELRLTKAQEEHQSSIDEHKVAKNKIKELEMDLYAERNAKKQLKRDLEVLKPRKSLKARESIPKMNLQDELEALENEQ